MWPILLQLLHMVVEDEPVWGRYEYDDLVLVFATGVKTVLIRMFLWNVGGSVFSITCIEYMSI